MPPTTSTSTITLDPALRPWMTEARERHLRERLAPHKVSVAGLRCADIISRWLRGLHHLPGGADRVDWSRGHVAVVYNRELATYDAADLTTLAVLAHIHAVRVSVRPCNMAHLRVLFHPRARFDPENPCGMTQHATLDEVLARYVNPGHDSL